MNMMSHWDKAQYEETVAIFVTFRQMVLLKGTGSKRSIFGCKKLCSAFRVDRDQGVLAMNFVSECREKSLSWRLPRETNPQNCSDSSQNRDGTEGRKLWQTLRHGLLLAISMCAHRDEHCTAFGTLPKSKNPCSWALHMSIAVYAEFRVSRCRSIWIRVCDSMLFCRQDGSILRRHASQIQGSRRQKSWDSWEQGSSRNEQWSFGTGGQSIYQWSLFWSLFFWFSSCLSFPFLPCAFISPTFSPISLFLSVPPPHPHTSSLSHTFPLSAEQAYVCRHVCMQ